MRVIVESVSRPLDEDYGSPCATMQARHFAAVQCGACGVSDRLKTLYTNTSVRVVLIMVIMLFVSVGG